ncbi:MAG: hypothetical protein ACT4QB_08060 [Gammaproteobacteria bacterium]
MQVLNFFSDQHKLTSVDVFVTEPFDFDSEYDNALKGDLAPGLPVHFVSIPTLISMKETAARPRDLDDIQHPRWILIERKEDESDRYRYRLDPDELGRQPACTVAPVARARGSRAAAGDRGDG